MNWPDIRGKAREKEMMKHKERVEMKKRRRPRVRGAGRI